MTTSNIKVLRMACLAILAAVSMACLAGCPAPAGGGGTIPPGHHAVNDK